jgi:hypothetical protein
MATNEASQEQREAQQDATSEQHRRSEGTGLVVQTAPPEGISQQNWDLFRRLEQQYPPPRGVCWEGNCGQPEYVALRCIDHQLPPHLLVCRICFATWQHGHQCSVFYHPIHAEGLPYGYIIGTHDIQGSPLRQ